MVERWFLTCLAAVALATSGCFAGASNSEDPPVQTVDAPGIESSKPAPDVYWAKLDTTKGDVLIEVHRKWSPNGADRFYELVQAGFYDQCRLFRVVDGFIVQTGIAANPAVTARWKKKSIADDHLQRRDPNRQSNQRGFVTFAKSALPDSRSTQIFINCATNSRLDGMGFTPFGKVLAGMDAVDSFYGGYGEEPQKSSERIEIEGETYLEHAFPKLDTIKKATLLSTKPELPKQKAG